MQQPFLPQDPALSSAVSSSKLPKKIQGMSPA